MALPKGPQILTANSADLPSIEAPGCLVAGKPLGVLATKPVFTIKGKAFTNRIVVNGFPCDLVTGSVAIPDPTGVVAILCAVPKPRQVVAGATGNDSVYFEKTLPAITPGSSTRITGPIRGIPGPIQMPTVRIGAYTKKP